MSKSDRELLELAAKAAGLNPSEHDGVIYAGFGSREWNPLTDDGDALRLAVDLDIEVFQDYVLGPRSIAYHDSNRVAERPMSKVELHETDRYAATRRAITRAAAAIGEQMS